VNAWLFSTDLRIGLSEREVGQLTGFLTRLFPDRAIVFRGVNSLVFPHLVALFAKLDYLLMRSRRVWVYDPSLRNNKNIRRDLNLLKGSHYDIRKIDHLEGEDCRRVTELYRLLYLDKYSRYNPHYRNSFFDLVARSRLLDFYVWKDPETGRIDAFSAFHDADGDVLCASLLGYCQAQPRQLGLYRQAIALKIRAAQESGKLLLLSAGAGSFKRHRRALPCIEYDAVYTRHLPRARRTVWGFLQKIFRMWELFEFRLFD
jgi:hypothetical protein